MERPHGHRAHSTRPPLARRAALSAAIVLALAGCGSDAKTARGSTAASDTAAPTTSATVASDAPVTGHLLFSRFDESSHTFESTHVVAADGSGDVELTMPGPEGGGRWSHAGSEIAVMTVLDDQRVGTAILTPDGTVERTLAITDPALNLVCTVWSPDDERLACQGWDDNDATRAGIYAVDAADGGHLVRVTTAPDGVSDIPGDYAPDGTELLLKRAPDEQNGQLMLTDPTSLGDPTPFASGEFEDPGRFSPDGSLVATSANGTLIVLGSDGSAHGTIGVTGHYLFGPSWSPTGEWLAYSSAPGGVDADIVISHPDGTDARQVTDTPDDNEIVVEWGRA